MQPAELPEMQRPELQLKEDVEGGARAEIPDDLAAYANSIKSVPAVQQLMATAAQAPAVPIYDASLRGLGGIPQPT